MNFPSGHLQKKRSFNLKFSPKVRDKKIKLKPKSPVQWQVENPLMKVGIMSTEWVPALVHTSAVPLGPSADKPAATTGPRCHFAS